MAVPFRGVPHLGAEREALSKLAEDPEQTQLAAYRSEPRQGAYRLFRVVQEPRPEARATVRLCGSVLNIAGDKNRF